MMIENREEMQEIIQIRLPRQVSQIISRLQGAGYEAYAVGGCVRDSILGREPDDWDITTSAKPEQVKALFVRTVDTGIQHGTVTVLLDKQGFEVTTYRIDGEYEDSRHPKEVTFTASLREDLRRRDFTINAMAYNEQEGLIDIFDGVGDMKRQLIRCVGDPGERFTEDALRMMRAVRFSAQLGYRIEEHTREAIGRLAHTLEKISVERINVELTKLLVSPYPERILDCFETGMTAVFLPEFDRIMETEQHNPHHFASVGLHTVQALKAVENKKVLRLAMLFHDMGKAVTRSTDSAGVDHFFGHAEQSAQIARRALRRLRYDNETTDRVVRLVQAHDVRIEPGEKYMRRAMNRIGVDLFADLFAVKQADLLAQSDHQKKEKQAALDELRRLYEKVIAAGSCVSLKMLAVSGSDLIADGMKPGRHLGDVLQALLEMVLEDPERNNKAYLLEQARHLE